MAWGVVLAVTVVTCTGPPGAHQTEIDPRVVGLGIDSDAPYPAISPLHPEPAAVLFVGNSYTFFSELPRVYRELGASVGQEPSVVSVTAAGYWLWMHARDAATPGTALERGLERDWDVVTLQEQSQLASFPLDQHEVIASREAAASLARRTRAPIVLYATWGHERGDEANPHLSPDFETMEARLERGYRAMVARLERDGHRVRIAPVGAAFARVHRASRDAGQRPTARGAAFDALYADDGSHPSPAGTYLAACVIYGTLTGRDPLTLGDAPSLDLDSETQRALRLVARATLADPAWRP